MTYQHDFTLPTELLEQISSQGLDILPELIRVMINSAMQVEHQKYLGVGPYERSPERRAHANGLEVVSSEIHRRTRVACIFPNEASCLRLISAILMEISEDWETGRKYLTFERF